MEIETHTLGKKIEDILNKFLSITIENLPAKYQDASDNEKAFGMPHCHKLKYCCPRTKYFLKKISKEVKQRHQEFNTFVHTLVPMLPNLLFSYSSEDNEESMMQLLRKFSKIYVEHTVYEIEPPLKTFNEPPRCHTVNSYSVHLTEFYQKSILRPSSMTPFVRTAIFGTKTDTFAINLSGNDKVNEIVLTYGNLISIYDYAQKKDDLLYGHRNKIVCSAIDNSGKWLVTSDKGQDPMIIVWDIKRRFPVHVIKNFHPTGCSYTKLSPCGRFLLTLVDTEQSHVKALSLWDWPRKKPKPDVTIEIDEEDYGKLQKISFYFDRCDFIMLTTQWKVLFLTIKEKIFLKVCATCHNEETDKENVTIECTCEDNDHINRFSISYYNPKISNQDFNIGLYNDSTYIRGTNMAITGTNKGYIIVWSDQPNIFNTKPKTLNNNKNFVRVFELDTQPIKLVKNIERYVVTVNYKGHMTFYDNNLIVAYKLADLGYGIPVNISFNLDPKTIVFNTSNEKHKYGETFNTFEKNLKYFNKNLKENGATLKLMTQELEKEMEYKGVAANGKSTRINDWRKNINPVYCISNPKNQFQVRDFIITTDRGNIYYVNVNHDELFEIKVICLKEPSFIDVHPREDLLAVSNNHGVIYLFDYINIQILMEVDVFGSSERSDSEPEKEQDIEKKCISCLKYSNDGRLIACGTRLGSVHLLDGMNLQTLYQEQISSFPIVKLIFSKLNTSFAFFDTNGEIYLYTLNNEVKCIGKIKPHFMELTDAIFFTKLENNSLFTVGEDGHLIEFDVNECENKNSLESTSKLYFEEFAKSCHLEISKEFTTVLLVFNNKLECRYICVETFEIICTVKGPSCGPVSFTQYLNPPCIAEEYIFFKATDNIGLIKLPFDGNPFRIISQKAGNGQMKNVLSACVGKDREHVFSITENEGLVLWKLNLDVLNEMEKLGGNSVKPFLKAINLTPLGLPLKNIELMFAAVREIYIKNSEVVEQASKANLIPVCEIPNFVKALGAYPSNKECKNILSESLECQNLNKNIEVIDFEKCLKLYYNYKNQISYSEQEIKEAFVSVSEAYNGRPYYEKPCLNKDDLLTLLMSEGFTLEEILNSLKELLREKMQEFKISPKKKAFEDLSDELNYVYENMPCTMSFEYFMTTLLGLSQLKI